jgi:hypothetical protein
MPPRLAPHVETPPGADAWRAWTPVEAARKLAGVAASWCVAGGWALDLWRGRQTRPHDDLEIAILRCDLDLFRSHLKGVRFYAAGSGHVSVLPADAQPPPEKHQVWVLEEPARVWRMDMLLEPGDADVWVCRRDPAIRRPRPAMLGLSSDGIPYLKPEGVLIYKAKAVRPKDETDFAACAPLMDAEARRWLRDALARAHPGHPWLAALG